MSIAFIRANFNCDGCDKRFSVDIDPARRAWLRRQAIFDIAVDTVRGGIDSQGNFCSVQANMHLCHACTDVVDNIKPDTADYEPSRDEIVAALGGTL